MSQALANKRIWLTRPAHQAQAWARVLQAAGAAVRRVPLLEIEPPADPKAALWQLKAAEQADAIIATSANAVRGAWQLQPSFDPTGALHAVGAATADALEQAAGRVVTRPQAGTTSEDLLALPVFQAPRGQRVGLLTGEGGRTLLADTLAARGARVQRAALYRRAPAAIDAVLLDALLAESDVIVVTSGAALAYLIALADTRRRRVRLAACRLVAPSTRVVEQYAQPLCFARPPVVPERMSAAAVVAALARLWQSGRQ